MGGFCCYVFVGGADGEGQRSIHWGVGAIIGCYGEIDFFVRGQIVGGAADGEGFILANGGGHAQGCGGAAEAETERVALGILKESVEFKDSFVLVELGDRLGFGKFTGRIRCCFFDNGGRVIGGGDIERERFGCGFLGVAATLGGGDDEAERNGSFGAVLGFGGS